MQHPHFSKINQPGGLLLLFSHRDVQNTENEKNSFVWKLLKLTGEVNFGLGANGSGHKIHFLWLNPFFRGKYPNLMSCSLRERGIFVTSFLLNQFLQH